MNKLKPCPFCGEEPQLKEMRWPNGSVSYRIRCMNELCCQPFAGDYSKRESAEAVWNYRPADKRKAELLQDIYRMELKVEELEKHLEEKDAIIYKLVLRIGDKNE